LKVYICADIEGVAGIAHWDESRKKNNEYHYFAEQMTKEVVKACEGAILAGATEVIVKDSHGSGRNINPDKLPSEVKLIRGWSGHPFSMMQELDESFDAVLMIGHHSAAGAEGNPMAHTMGGCVELRLNGKVASEFVINSYTAAFCNVPVVFLSGDKHLCLESRRMIPHLSIVETNVGIGNSVISNNSNQVLNLIKEKCKLACSEVFQESVLKLPESFLLEIEYKIHPDAYKASFYPGAELISPRVLQYSNENYFEILRAINFIL